MVRTVIAYSLMNVGKIRLQEWLLYGHGVYNFFIEISLGGAGSSHNSEFKNGLVKALGGVETKE